MPVISPFITGFVGLFGVWLGGYLTGHFQLESQRAALQQAENVERYHASSELAQQLVKTAADYFAELALLQSVTDGPDAGKELDAHMRVIQRSAYELAFMTTPETAQKLFAANVYAIEWTQKRNDPIARKALEAKSNIYAEAYFAVFGEVWKLRWNSAPPPGPQDKLLDKIRRFILAPPQPTSTPR